MPEKIKVRLKVREEPYEVNPDEIEALRAEGILVEVLTADTKTPAGAKAASEKQGA